jgi:hypothetical protein
VVLAPVLHPALPVALLAVKAAGLATPASWALTSAPQASGGATGSAQHGKPPSAHRPPASAPKHSAAPRSSPESWFVSCIGLFGGDIADLAVIGLWPVTTEMTAQSLRGQARRRTGTLPS